MAKDGALAGDLFCELLQSAPHQGPVCTSCRHKDQACGQGPTPTARLQAAFAATRVATRFIVSCTAFMAGFDHPGTVARRAMGNSTWLFGDSDPDTDIDDPMTFAFIYQRFDDVWCRAADRLGKLAHITLARIPAALTVSGSHQ